MILSIDKLEAYSLHVMEEINAINRCETAVTVEGLVKFLQEHTEEQNTLMLTLVPEHDVSGNQDGAQWVNTVGFYFLEKTDYSQHDTTGYLSIFKRTQAVAAAFVEKLIADKSDNTGLFCGFLAFMNERSLSVSPVANLSGCNGYFVQVDIASNV